MGLVIFVDKINEYLIFIGRAPGRNPDFGSSVLGTSGQNESRRQNKTCEASQNQPKIFHETSQTDTGCLLFG
jgi:hypothetical protein